MNPPTELLDDPDFHARVTAGLRDYGEHRDERFMTRRLAKEAAALIEHLTGRA